jgi:hypothetical protein
MTYLLGGDRFASLIPYGKKSCATVTPMHSSIDFKIREVGTIVRIDESRASVMFKVVF